MPDTGFEWPYELTQKYNVPGPRYTSYPTAPLFSTDFGACEYKQAVLAANEESIAPLSLYLHIPFCRDICYYCGCNKVVTRDEAKAQRYLTYLTKEMALVNPLINPHRKVMQLHLGGGTPTFLNHAQLTELMHELASHFFLVDSPQREYSIEIDPRTVTTETLALLRGLGFNRLSFGIQDFDPKVQEAIHRIQSVEEIRELTEATRKLGFNSLSYDLIYGLPHQSDESLAQTAKTVIELRPDRIACYNYAHLPERFSSQRAIDRLALPTANEKLRMLGTLNHLFSEAGYRYLGMDHFVLPEDDLAVAQAQKHLQRNFQGYSTVKASELIGLGVSAISTLPGYYAQNAKMLDGYYRQLDLNDLPIERGLALNRDDVIRNDVIMQLMCNLNLSTEDFADKYGESFWDYFAAEAPKLEAMRQDGLIERHGDMLVITETGRVLLRNIAMAFDKYLDHDNAKKFSKAI